MEKPTPIELVVAGYTPDQAAQIAKDYILTEEEAEDLAERMQVLYQAQIEVIPGEQYRK